MWLEINKKNMENEVKLTIEEKNEILYKAIDALIDVADDLGFNSHEIKNFCITTKYPHFKIFNQK
jgi:hypothetical protein